MMHQKKLFLLDAYALIYRAYFAFIKNPRINAKGLNTSAIYGFTNTILEIIKKENPSHLAVVFDVGGDTFRHKQFAEYKANRDPTPEGIITAVPYITQILEAFNIQQLSLKGYEADDVIGTIAKQAEKEHFSVYMMTPDKDFAQLVTDNIFMYRPATKWSKSEVWGVPEVLEKFEISNVSQVVDFLGMMGDAVDNIPGLPGVGKKTAIKFIKEYNSLEGLLKNTDKIKGKLKEKIILNKEQGLLSKKLATIDTEVPIKFNKSICQLRDFNKQLLYDIFNELEFKTLIKRLDLNASNYPKENFIPLNNNQQLDMFFSNEDDAPDKIDEFKAYEKIDDLDFIYDRINSVKTVSFQFGFKNNSDNQAVIVSLGICIAGGQAYFISLENKKFNSFIKNLFNDNSILKIGYNIKYQSKILTSYAPHELNNVFDIGIAQYLLEPDRRVDIMSIVEQHLPRSLSANNFSKLNRSTFIFEDLSEDEEMESTCEFVDANFQLHQILRQKLVDSKCYELFEKIEMPLIHVLKKMEIEGIRLDKKILHELSHELEHQIKLLENEIFQLSGEKFNLSSPKQLGKVLFEKMEISKKAKKTKSGQYSTSEENLSKLIDAHVVIPKILKFRRLQKLMSTYINALPLLINPITNRVHTTFNQNIASTGRLSSMNPNLQNIPIKTENGKKIRLSFIPRNKEYQLLAADYSQIELRIMADLSNDATMIRAFKNNEDIHSATAAKVYNVILSEVSPEMRSNAKMVNFGIIYGISSFGLSQKLQIKKKEASQIIEQYFEKFPEIKRFIDKSIIKAKENEYVTTKFGRKRFLKNINSRNALLRNYDERNAINAPIQGLAADIIKKAMIEIHSDFEKLQLKSKMILQVHDELIFDVLQEEMEVVRKIVKNKMEGAAELNVPLTVEIGTGKNWLEAH
ncbi:MAG: DNA polymerase I [Flavobacteriales bacterium]|nr:DNA polymerase I [Flavobacteriales bacterium]